MILKTMSIFLLFASPVLFQASQQQARLQELDKSITELTRFVYRTHVFVEESTDRPKLIEEHVDSKSLDAAQVSSRGGVRISMMRDSRQMEAAAILRTLECKRKILREEIKKSLE